MEGASEQVDRRPPRKYGLTFPKTEAGLVRLGSGTKDLRRKKNVDEKNRTRTTGDGGRNRLRK